MVSRFWETLRAEVAHYTPNASSGMKHANILLVGQVGAGKSSFFNTITSIYRGHVTLRAPTGAADHSVTTQVSKLHRGFVQLTLRRSRGLCGSYELFFNYIFIGAGSIIVAGVGLGGKPIMSFVLPCVVQCLKSVPLLCRLTLV